MGEESEQRTELAEDRTEWADQRTYLAQERTFAGWVRTGLTSMAVGLGILEFVRELEPEWLITAIGLIFIVVGGGIEVLAFMSHRNISLSMSDNERPDMAVSVWWTGAIAGGLILASLGGLVLVFW